MPEENMTDEEFMAVCHAGIRKFKGDIREFERAVGTLFVARYTGWKPLYLMQDRKSLKKYEGILEIKFQEAVPAEGKFAQRSVAWTLLTKAKKTITNFWAVVRGEAHADIRRPDFQTR